MTKNKKHTTMALFSLFLLAIIILNCIPPQIAASKSLPNPREDYHYYTYPEMTELFYQLVQNHSDIMTLTSIGTTYQQRDIWLVKLSDNPTEEEKGEPSVLFMGAHHGNERPSFEVCIYFIKYMINKYTQPNYDDDQDGTINEDPFDGIDNDHDGHIDEDPSEDRVRELLNTTQMYLIPMVNPDGVAHDTRKNREPNYGPDGNSPTITSYGVDLNRNYGYRWNIVYLAPDAYFLDDITDDKSHTYRGEKPFSEKESTAVKQFIENHHISISLSYHDYGEWMIFPWMHTSRFTPHEKIFRSIGASISQINKYELKLYGRYGSRDYIIPRYCGTPGTSENWLYGEHQIIAYTIELCQHRPELNPNRVLDTCWKHVGVNLFVCERSHTLEKEITQLEQSIQFKISMLLLHLFNKTNML